MEVGEEVALPGVAGVGVVGGEVWGKAVEKKQIALRHMLVEVTLHYAGVDEVLKELISDLTRIEYLTKLSGYANSIDRKKLFDKWLGR